MSDVTAVEGTSVQRRNLALLALAEFLGLTLWFSSSAVNSAIRDAWGLSSGQSAWLVMAVQIGFVVGTFVSGLLNLPDVMSSRRLFALCAGLGALSNAGFALAANGLATGILFRLLTGMFLAGVYPPGMKLATTWTVRSRGLAVGIVVGALTIGSASPHLVRSLVHFDWPWVVLVSSGLAAMGGLIVLLFVEEGPFTVKATRFDPRFVVHVARDRSLRLANLGYLGHMWELYAMWTWVPVFLHDLLTGRGMTATTASILSFAIIGIGGLSCVAAGGLADRWGRTATTSALMLASGASAIVAASLTSASLWLLIPVLFVWGLTIVADSAQFSAAISELCPPAYVGSALTIQTSLGFLLTIGSIQLVPVLVDAIGWPVAFLILAIGPAVGIAGMLGLRRLPEAAALANGRR